MNRKSFLLIGLLTDFRRYLASGLWPASDMCCYCFLSHRFHRFFMESLANSFVQSQGYLYRPNRSPPRQSVSNRLSRKSPTKFRVIRWTKKSASSAKSAWQKLRWKIQMKKICVYLWNLWDIFQSQGYLYRPNRSLPRQSVSNRLRGNLRLNSVWSDE